MIIGHSFGGKVVLALNELMPVKQVWVWGTEPGLKKPGHTGEVLKKVKHVPMPQPTRKTLQEGVRHNN